MALTQEQRDALDSSEFAVPKKRALPIPDAEHVKLAHDMVDRTEGLTDKERQKARKRIKRKARELGINELLTLSTQAFTYFQSKAGFTEGTPDDLPPARREKYDQSGRNSKVLVKKLAKAA